MTDAETGVSAESELGGGRTASGNRLLAVARYEAGRKVRGSVALSALLALVTAMYVGLYPSITSSGVDLDAYIQSLPPAFQEAFGVSTLTTIEGFLAVELYQFAWVLLLGVYFAYSAASLVADDVEHDRMDLLLSTPTPRGTVVVGKFLSMLVPILVVNAVVFAAVFVGTALVDEPIAVMDLLAAHALSVPYLLACSAIGLLLSVTLDRASTAQRGAIGVVFGLFLLETVTANTDFQWVGALAPTRYYDPTAILVDGEYGVVGAAVLLGATAVLVAVARAWFRRRDLA
ncbi:ABC transporter permease subunit [Haloprofundus sp. MHR1]|uniref:ABC transporter permease subunit n=1 Tax=Haloprofundus sp. MHR1 TaxID=2572921 RepID=UPI0010BF3474|nr:ABC transporter permease subunit [Haloprofundus sp. MHR1]QCJ46740.1 ABC transporter permease [Haloprofundus sp. MHR1]